MGKETEVNRQKEVIDRTLFLFVALFGISMIALLYSMWIEKQLAIIFFGIMDVIFAALLGIVGYQIIKSNTQSGKLPDTQGVKLLKTAKKDEDGSTTRKGILEPRSMLQWLLVALTVSAIGILGVAEVFRPEFALPFMLIFGVVVLLISLTISAIVFNTLRIKLKDFALGLPPGSVRAIIALSLIVIFAITVVQLENSTIVWPNGTITQAQNTTVLLEPTQAEKDFSLQTLTTISTLVVAVAGFYFGAKAVSVARGEEEPEISVNPSGTRTLKKSDKQPITVKPKPDTEGYKSEIIGDTAEALEQHGDSFTYTPTKAKAKDTVTIKFSLKKYPEVSEELKLTIEDEQSEETNEGVEKPENKKTVIEVESPSGDLKAKIGQPLNIKLKTTPENKEVKGEVDKEKGDLKKVENTKAEFNFTPSDKCTVGEKVTLTFTGEGDKEGTSIQVTIEAKK
ncbi:MAG: hypothetical protein P8Y18_07405 [Candidatus Bathyarchaeota archaeon]